MVTSITVSEETARELNRLKYLYGLKTIEDVIKRHIKIQTKKEVEENVR